MVLVLNPPLQFQAMIFVPQVVILLIALFFLYQPCMLASMEKEKGVIRLDESSYYAYGPQYEVQPN